MNPQLSLSAQAAYRAAQLQLVRLPHDQLLARCEQLMLAALRNQQLLSQAMKRIAELELQALTKAELNELLPPPVPPARRGWGLLQPRRGGPGNRQA